jgi:basic membrane protein A and related proteins
MMLKKLSVLMLSIILLTLLVGCGGETEIVTEEEQLRVALVIGLLGDRSFLDSAAAGMAMVNEEYPEVFTRIIENADVGEQQLGARAMAEEGYDLVITVGFGSADWTDEIAQEYPNTNFAIVDAVLESPNGTGLTFREDEGSFTVGMVAAMLTETGKVGYIGGMDVPLLRRFELGFIQGVKYVNPDVEVVSGWVGAFNDPSKGLELAMTQYAEGVDIIYAAAGRSGEGVLQASRDVGLYAIGVDSDQDYIQPGHVITSMLKRVDLAVFQAVKALVEGDLTGGQRVFGLAEGMVGSTFLYNDDTIFLQQGPADMVATIKSDVMPAIKTASEAISSGQMCVQDYMELFPCASPPQPGGMP